MTQRSGAETAPGEKLVHVRRAPIHRTMTMAKHRVYAMKFAKVYPLYVQKAQRKNRTKEEVDQIICWLTGYDQAGLQRHRQRVGVRRVLPGIRPCAS